MAVKTRSTNFLLILPDSTSFSKAPLKLPFLLSTRSLEEFMELGRHGHFSQADLGATSTRPEA